MIVFQAEHNILLRTLFCPSFIFQIPFESRNASLCPHDRELKSCKVFKFKLLAKGEPQKITAWGVIREDC
jgi:hypothetical protein